MASNIPPDKELWLLVKVAEGYCPLTDPIDVASNGTWSANASLGGPLGGPFDVEKSFVLYTALADQDGSTALSTSLASSRASGKFLPISLPRGVQLMSHVQAVRAATHITITSPGEDAQVPQSVTVQGTASNIPPDKELWLLVQSGGVNGYFPQGDAINPNPIVVSSDNWTVTARIGELTDPKGTQYVLHLALVDQNSAGRGAIEQYFAQGKKTGQYVPLTLPLKGIELIGSQVHVVRAPLFTITSPKDGSSVPTPPVQITVQGTAPTNIPPDKELWLLVEAGNGYFPQGDAKTPTPIVVANDGTWNVIAYVGIDTDPKGMEYVLHLALIDKNSKGRAAIEQYFADARAGKGYNGIYPLPQGIQLVAKATVVYK